MAAIVMPTIIERMIAAIVTPLSFDDASGDKHNISHCLGSSIVTVGPGVFKCTRGVSSNTTKFNSISISLQSKQQQIFTIPNSIEIMKHSV